MIMQKCTHTFLGVTVANQAALIQHQQRAGTDAELIPETQLRNFTESDWFDAPNVTAINADENYGPTASQFSLTVKQSAPSREEAP